MRLFLYLVLAIGIVTGLIISTHIIILLIIFRVIKLLRIDLVELLKQRHPANYIVEQLARKWTELDWRICMFSINMINQDTTVSPARKAEAIEWLTNPSTQIVSITTTEDKFIHAFTSTIIKRYLLTLLLEKNNDDSKESCRICINTKLPENMGQEIDKLNYVLLLLNLADKIAKIITIGIRSGE